MGTLYSNMTQHDDNYIESFLKKTSTQVTAPRALFDMVMRSVTPESVHRNTHTKAVPLSPYQSSLYVFMKKVVAIGVPVAVLALVVMIQTQRRATPSDMTSAPSTTVPSSITTIPSDASLDTIFSSFVTDADLDAREANDTAQDDMLQTQIQDYTDIKTI